MGRVRGSSLYMRIVCCWVLSAVANERDLSPILKLYHPVLSDPANFCWRVREEEENRSTVLGGIKSWSQITTGIISR